MERAEWLGGYRLVRRLGTGGAATVWEASDEGGMRVALKLLHPALAATQQARERLVREAAALNRIRTPGVARVVDLEVDAPQPFVATELVDGETLASRLRRGPLQAAEAAELARDMAATLTTVHAAGVVHRDLKPSNVILARRGPVLIDFGIAQVLDQERLTRAGMVSGTPGFVSPEVLRGAPVRAAADWWAWSATVLSACTGRAPFGTGPMQAVLEREALGDPDVRGLPAGAARAFREALAPDPRTRSAPAALLSGLRDSAPADESDPERGGDEAAPAPDGEDAPTRVLDGADAPTQAVPASAPAQGDGAEGATRVLPRSTPAPPAVEPGRTRVLPQAGGGAPAPPEALPRAPQVPPEDAYAPAPYAARLARPTPLASAALLAALAMPPVLLGRPGGLAVLAVLVAAATAGSARRWREARREAWGAPRRSDTPLMIAWLPRHLVWGAVGVAFGLAAGALAATGAWVGVRLALALRVAWTWPVDVLAAARADLGAGAPLTDPLLLAVMWGLAWLALLVAWTTPAWVGVREGIDAALRWALPPAWARAVFGVLVAGILASAWLIVTGGLA